MNRSLRWKLPLFLYLLTWLTTTGFRINSDLRVDAGAIYHFFLAALLTPFNSALAMESWAELGRTLLAGLEYSVPLMLILTCHEFGHYIQTRRYGVRSSLPYFIPMPMGPFGTLGAVIGMDGRIPNSRALFDIGISGPIAGLIPTLFCLYFGIHWSWIGPVSGQPNDMVFGEPLLFQYLSYWIYGPIPPDMVLYAHPVALAGWVGLFLTSLNFLPFSQLDGGHVFYALLGRRAARFSWAIFYVIVVLVVFFRLWHWALILILLSAIGVSHPPTADDTMPLTPFRRVLGWCMLAFVVIGLTPTPITINEPKAPEMYCRVRSFSTIEHQGSFMNQQLRSSP